MRNLRQGNLVIPELELGGWDFTSFHMPMLFKYKLILNRQQDEYILNVGKFAEQIYITVSYTDRIFLHFHSVLV